MEFERQTLTAGKVRLNVIGCIMRHVGYSVFGV